MADLDVAIISPDRRMRLAIGAVIHIELGLAVRGAEDVLQLLEHDIVPHLIVWHHHPTAELAAIYRLNALFPDVPIIDIGTPAEKSARATRTLEVPVDPERLIMVVSGLLGFRVSPGA